MKALCSLACCALAACTPIKTAPRMYIGASGTQKLSSADPQDTVYRVTLKRAPDAAVQCGLGTESRMARSGVFDAGDGSVFDPSLATSYLLQAATPDADGGLAWWNLGGSKLMPGKTVAGSAPLWEGTSEERVQYLRVHLEPGIAPPDATDYTYEFGIDAYYARDSVDIETQDMTLEVLTDGGWLPTGGPVHRSGQLPDCTLPMTPLGCR